MATRSQTGILTLQKFYISSCFEQTHNPQSSIHKTLNSCTYYIQQYKQLLKKMKQKSKSMRELTSLPPIKDFKKQPALNYQSRLVFPIVGDTSFYRNYGRKHYQCYQNNNSDRLFKIILPQNYSLEKTPLRRERSISLPKLHSQFCLKLHNISDVKFNNSTELSKQKTFKYLKNKNIVQNEINFSNQFLQKQKNARVSVQNPEKRVSFKDNDQILQKKLSLKSCTIEAQVVPKQIAELIPKQQTSTKDQRKPLLLYKPENKQIYEKLAAVRSKNPTHLSTGLSII